MHNPTPLLRVIQVCWCGSRISERFFSMTIQCMPRKQPLSCEPMPASRRNCGLYASHSVARRRSVVVRLHLGLDKPGRHAFDLVSLLAPLPCPGMGFPTGLRADAHRGQLRQPLALLHRSRGVRPHEAEDCLAGSMPTVYTFCWIGFVSSRRHDGQVA